MQIVRLTRRLPWCLAAGLLVLAPAAASAQSTISGLVRDATGAVLPGVTVEVSSPVLIEKVRTGVTDAQGRYSIVDLRPGIYTVVFTLTGFNTYRHEGLELPSNFTATVNADLRVGSLEESITVTGASPVVDVQSTQRTQVLSRDLLDSVPTARNYSGLAALMPGVRMSNTDVGGNQQMEQIYMSVGGRFDTTVQVDGMMVNSLMFDGEIQGYFSDAANAEMTYSTSGIGAEVSGGGLRINMIPKEGGNRFSGSAFVGGTDGKWQSNNITDELRQRGLVAGDRVAHIQDLNFALGGPIKKDKLWFFGTWRYISTDEVVANNFYPDGTQGVEDQWIQNQLVRLTWQINPKHKFTAYHDRFPKFKGHEMGALWDPERAALRREPDEALYYMGQAKWTFVATPRLLFETGYSTNVEYVTIKNQLISRFDRGTDGWYAGARQEDLLLRTINNSGGLNYGIDPHRFVISSSASYVTGSHNLKAGVQWSFGSHMFDYTANGDLYQYYFNRAPALVLVFNTPVAAKESLNADLGTFVQDTWTINRLTVNAGIRFEYFNAQIDEQAVEPGRFAPVRELARVPNMPNWFDIAPRFGVSYDLFGNGRTALKASVNKYVEQSTIGFPQRYNPNQLQFEVRTWADRNNDNIAQDSEIGAAQNQRFGQPVFTIRPEDGIKREFDMVYNVGVQHELRPGFAVTANWNRRGAHNLRRTDNTLITLDDYSPIDIVNPHNGEGITIYNLNPTKLGLVDRLDVTAADSDKRRRTYNGLELGFNARMGRGSAFGGYTFERVLSAYCDGSNQGATFATTISTDPNTLRFCDDRLTDVPFRHEVKFAGSYLLPWWDIQLNAALQSYSGNARRITWTLSRTTRYPATCPDPCQALAGTLVVPNLVQSQLIVDLIPPNSTLLNRHNQLDFGVRKLFRIRNMQWSGQVDVFNMLNSARINTLIEAFGPSLDQPTAILQPRTLRLAMQMRF